MRVPDGLEYVARVLRAEVAVEHSSPHALVIRAWGEVTSTGWTEPELVGEHYFDVPRDGIYDFAFVARPPLSDAETCSARIEVEHRWVRAPLELIKGVRVYTSGHDVEARL